jgi:predicted transcriptional regulator
VDHPWRSSPTVPNAILWYGKDMATRKVTITLDEDLVEGMTRTARRAGIPLSRLIASAAEREMRRRIGQSAVAEWEAEHGAFTPEELAAARAEMAAADDEYYRAGGDAA